MHEAEQRQRIAIPALVEPDLEPMDSVDVGDVAWALRQDAASFFGPGLGSGALAERTQRSARGAVSRPRVMGGRIHADAPWRIVVPERASRGPAPSEMLRALEPLSKHRRALDPLTFSNASDDSAIDAVGRFCDLYSAEIARTTYFVFAGNGTDLPLLIQQRLAIGKGVGRLGFDRREDFATYAERVVNAERHNVSAPHRPMLAFGPDSDKATGLSFKVLVEPIIRALRRERGARPVISLLGQEATKDNFLARLSSTRQDAPSLLFSATHGMECRDPAHEDQGALADQGRALIRARDLVSSGEPILENGIAVLFACNSGGTPGDRWWPRFYYRRPTRAPEQDRLSHLPMAMLSSRRGVLAVVAHLDLLTDWGLRGHDGHLASGPDYPGIASHLKQLTLDLARSVPVGLAIRLLQRTAAELQQYFVRVLLTQCRGTTHDCNADYKLASAWLRWYDTQGWILLGDPRVCLEGARARLTLDTVMRGEEMPPRT